ncbi:FAD-binding domain-containing protein [Xylaria digitata]|nr:FAD-binding domain-containing protein [Xylaria digitata]
MAASRSSGRSTAALQWPIGVALQYPGSDAFENATKRWSIYKAPTFGSSISPIDEEQVAGIVKVAAANKIPFLATSGRHGYGTSLGKLQNGLSIDLGNMKTLEIDTDAQTVTVGPGVKNGDLANHILDAGYQMPVGSCAEASVIGTTLGGGIGLFQGLFGLMIDALVSIRLVTANGDVVEVSASENSELFFGIRGAGANFGIITSATYKLFKPVNGGQVFTADIVYPENMRSDYFNALKTYEDTMPAELAMNTTINWNADSNQTQIIGTFVYSGSEAQAMQVLAPFFDLDPPVIRKSVVPFSQVPHVILFGMIAAMSELGNIHGIWTANVRRFAVDSFNSAFEKYDTFYKANPYGRMCAGVFEMFSNQAVAISGQNTSYPWRDCKGNFMFQMAWPELGNQVEQPASDLARSLREDFAATSGYPDLSVYVSYAHGDERLERIYGDSLPRLVALKKQWDPENIFRYSNGLPTELLPSSSDQGSRDGGILNNDMVG